MADDASKSTSTAAKPAPKPGSLKPTTTSSSSKKNAKDYKSLNGRQKAA